MPAVTVGVLSCHASTLMEETKSSRHFDIEALMLCKRDVWYSLRLALACYHKLPLVHATTSSCGSYCDLPNRQFKSITRRSMLLKVSKKASCVEHGMALVCRTPRCPGQRSLFVNITTRITNSPIINTSTPTTILNINPTELPTITHYHLLAYQRINISDYHNHKILITLCVYLASLSVQQRHSSFRGWRVNNVL